MLGAIGLSSLGYIACGGNGGSSATGTNNGGGGQKTLTQATLTSAIGSDVGSLDPQSLGGTGGGNWPGYETIFGGAGLAVVDPATKGFLPGIASSWQESPDHLIWTFNLNPNAKFHNGSPVTAADVKFSMDRNIGQAAYNPGYRAGYNGQFAPIVAGGEVVDDRTVRFTLKAPDVIFLRRPLFVLPKAYIEQVGDEGFARNPVGAGWYKFVSRIPDSEIRAERWDEYHLPMGSPGGYHPSYIKTLVQKVIPEDQARSAALQAGEVDLIHNVSADIARQLETDSKYVVHYLPGTQPMQIAINTALEVDPTTGRPNPFRDKRVRVAANMAVDLDTIIKTILTGREERTYGSNSHGFGFPEDLKAKRFKFDANEAKRLLSEAGYPNGFETSMYGPIGRWPNSRPVMEAVTQYLSRVGIRASIQELQYQEVTTRVQDKTLGPLIFWGQSGGDDPGANFRFSYHSSGNFSLGPATDVTPAGDVQPRINSLIEQSEREFDTEKRKGLLQDIISTEYLSAKSIWLYEPVTAVVTSNKWAWDRRSEELSTPEYWNIAPR